MIKSLFTVRDKKTGVVYRPSEDGCWVRPDLGALALEVYKEGQHIIYCDVETIAVGMNGLPYLIDECGNVAYLDPERFEILPKGGDNMCDDTEKQVEETRDATYLSVLQYQVQMMRFTLDAIAHMDVDRDDAPEWAAMTAVAVLEMLRPQVDKLQATLDKAD